MIEMDLRLTKDGEIVVFHDSALKRLFGVKRKIQDLTLGELKKISIDAGREIPTLDEVLKTVKNDLILELKVHGMEQQVLDAIKDFPHKVLVSSYYPGVLKKIRALDGNVPLGLIIVVRRFHMIAVVNFLTRNLILHSVHPRNLLISLPTMALLRLSGHKINVWTVNSEREFRRMKQLGVDGIFTDYPQLFKNR